MKYQLLKDWANREGVPYSYIFFHGHKDHIKAKDKCSKNYMAIQVILL